MRISKKRWYFLHRWLGLVVSVQLLAWSVGGFTFSVLPIGEVRGEGDAVEQDTEGLTVHDELIHPAAAVLAATSSGIPERDVAAVVLKHRLGRSVYIVQDADRQPLGVVDAETGALASPITESDAVLVAASDFAPGASVLSVDLLEGQPPLEYRGNPMPVYRVILDHAKKPHIYVSPMTGEVVKRRNRLWRIFDFFWMLHIMDYGQRDSFNHWLLTTMSLLAVLTSASGMALWCYRLPKRSRTPI